jgi:hypothetical protein
LVSRITNKRKTPPSLTEMGGSSFKLSSNKLSKSSSGSNASNCAVICSSNIERLVGRVSYGNVNARDLIQLKHSISEIPNIKNLLQAFDEQMTAPRPTRRSISYT